MTNPLLAARPLNALPTFADIKPEQAGPAVDQVIVDNRAQLDALLKDLRDPTWSSLIEPLEDIGERISRAWGPVSHLFSVTSTPEWRAAFNEGLPKVTEYSLELSQSEALYQAYKALSESAGFAKLNPIQQKVVRDALRDFRLSGIGLPPEQKERFKQISMRLSELQTKFEENVMDAIQAWSQHVTDASRLEGMSPAALEQAAAKAKAKNLEGWLLTLDYPSYDAVISYANDRDLRRELYTAYATRASDQGPQAGQFDNSPLMDEILELRHEEAQLLGYKNFAELSLATKMADSPDAVETFLLDLAKRSKARAATEVEELRAFARTLGGPDQLEPWDLAYYAEKLKEQALDLNDEVLRPYFPLPAVLDGLFGLIHRLYGAKVVAEPGVSVWHPQVTAYALQDAQGKTFGRFYLDPYAREQKRGGAWMDECVSRRRSSEGLQLPVAYLICNFRPPLGDQPGLLTHDELVTLYHEFGHGLHLLMTQVEESALAGIHGVEWDAVELPSQFMENWCYEPALLKAYARHWQTGEPLPDAQIDKLRESRVFQTGLATVRQVEFALFDLRLHRDFVPGQGARVLETISKVRDEVSVLRPPAFNRMPWSFSHIFAGGYAAGYYSYKWAEVLSADAFAAFEEAGLTPEKLGETGRRFLDGILSRGGSREAADLFREFRGREPSIEPLLRHNGLVAEPA
ncbi:oligopeptidase A [Panacagrimonas perspica]|uniref:oligopeptidase A n=1 Tax=Panacagrimonas perspica TaxID=381431 RepID=A0A4S3K0E1_9GAMM|nr:M3 family metallopeptidase [Panacagrimonas perspica]TDU23236.1 oligopeptidase A [Panacagrimonas perspica]THD01363.1 oligopeptidase A [Panacagrimonas perspica]